MSEQLAKLEIIIDAYVADYELDADTVSIVPDEDERYMIKDAIMGLLADTAWDAEWGALIDEQARKKAEAELDHLRDLLRIEQEIALRRIPFRCQNTECELYGQRVSSSCQCRNWKEAGHRAKVRAALADKEQQR